MSKEDNLLKISRFVASETETSKLVKRLGFPDGGEINRFLRESYGKAVNKMNYADRLKGHMFVLEPAVSKGTIASPEKVLSVLQKVKEREKDSVLALTLDVGKSETVVAQPSQSELATKVGGAWLNTHAQELSESLDKCVVIATGVSVSVFVSGKLRIEIADVVEGLDKGPQDDFQKLSWADGEILYFFAEHDLNNRSPAGIWRLPDKFVLKSNPETLIAERLESFLRYRMQGMSTLEREAHVENEGRLDLALHRTDGFIYIIEIKWMGRSITKTQQLNTDAAINDALKKKKKWFTVFNEDVIADGFKQVVFYCATGKFRQGYVSVFDCQDSGDSKTDRGITMKPSDGQDPSKFKIIRAAVDPRSASIKSKSKK